MTNTIEPSVRKQTPVGSSKWIFLACWLAYASAYIARGNFSFVRSTMIGESLITAEIAGLVSAVYFICYAAGQLINGILADRKSPFIMVMVGFAGVILANAAMMLRLPSWLYVILWAINGFAQSMLWSPIFFIISNILHERVRFTAITLIVLCTPAGKLSCSLVSGTVLKSGSWQSVFLVCSMIICAVLVLWITVYLATKKQITVQTAREAKREEAVETPAPAEKPMRLGRLLGVSGLLISFPALLVHGLFLNGVVELIPSILQKEYAFSAGNAALLESIIPIVGVAGVFFGNLIYLKLFRKNELTSCFFVMLLNVLPVLLMLVLAIKKESGFLLGQNADALLFVATYGLIYIFQLSFGHIMISLAPMRCAKFALAATMTGLTNAINYAGSAISTYGLSSAVERLPLKHTVTIWLVCLGVACLFLGLSAVKWTKFAKNQQFD